MKKIALIVLAAAIVATLVWIFFPTEEKKLRSDIRAIERAVETESADDIVDFLDLEYLDTNSMTRDDLVAVLRNFFAEVDSIRVQTSGLEVSIDSTVNGRGVFARCSLGVRVLARYEGERVLAFGGIVQPSSVRASFRKTEGKYKVYYAEY